ncbi:vesicle transport protein USE1 [Platysternon megacephalum]|uniref:Vesicle transport protein USE1 n=1 Tax=Platysternon megacephalum TaxID=55544 RepID=A0A4D9EMA4_9SAUR|nr:vesicle transport protein USE1 [Platysternon megacephalum]
MLLYGYFLLPFCGLLSGSEITLLYWTPPKLPSHKSPYTAGSLHSSPLNQGTKHMGVVLLHSTAALVLTHISSSVPNMLSVAICHFPSEYPPLPALQTPLGEGEGSILLLRTLGW